MRHRNLFIVVAAIRRLLAAVLVMHGARTCRTPLYWMLGHLKSLKSRQPGSHSHGLVFPTLVDELKSALHPQPRLEEVIRIIQQVIRDHGVPTGDHKMSVNVWARVDQVMPLGRVTEEVCLVSSSIQPPKLRTPTGYVKKEGQEPDLSWM